MAMPEPSAPSLRSTASSRVALQELSSALLSSPLISEVLSQNKYLKDRNNANAVLLALIPQLESDFPCLLDSCGLRQ